VLGLGVLGAGGYMEGTLVTRNLIGVDRLAAVSARRKAHRATSLRSVVATFALRRLMIDRSCFSEALACANSVDSPAIGRGPIVTVHVMPKHAEHGHQLPAVVRRVGDPPHHDPRS